MRVTRIPPTNEQREARRLVQLRERKAKKYGLTVAQLDKLEAIPACQICNRKPKPGKHLYTDHDHKTGRVRGRLCFTCNYRLLGRGALGDARVHREAAYYLESSWDARKDL